MFLGKFGAETIQNPWKDGLNGLSRKYADPMIDGPGQFEGNLSYVRAMADNLSKDAV